MKLVDILAREFKVWPDQYYQIYQDSGGSLHGTLSNDDLEDCAQEDLPFEPVSIAWDGSDAVVDRAEWQAAVDALNAPAVWDGKGMPPVGTVCEYQTWVNREWKQTKILAHHLGFAVHSWSVDGDDMEVDAAPPQDFRPIITPEQVAAEEREKAIEEIAKATGLRARDGRTEVATAIYDAGFRKQVAE